MNTRTTAFLYRALPHHCPRKTLPLEQVATIKKQKTPEIITTNQGRRSIEIVAKLNSEKLTLKEYLMPLRQSFCPNSIPNFKHKVNWRVALKPKARR